MKNGKCKRSPSCETCVYTYDWMGEREQNPTLHYAACSQGTSIWDVIPRATRRPCGLRLDGLPFLCRRSRRRPRMRPSRSSGLLVATKGLHYLGALNMATIDSSDSYALPTSSRPKVQLVARAWQNQPCDE